MILIDFVDHQVKLDKIDSESLKRLIDEHGNEKLIFSILAIVSDEDSKILKDAYLFDRQFSVTPDGMTTITCILDHFASEKLFYNQNRVDLAIHQA